LGGGDVGAGLPAARGAYALHADTFRRFARHSLRYAAWHTRHHELSPSLTLGFRGNSSRIPHIPHRRQRFDAAPVNATRITAHR
jgi:hypothetical protein